MNENDLSFFWKSFFLIEKTLGIEEKLLMRIKVVLKLNVLYGPCFLLPKISDFF